MTHNEPEKFSILSPEPVSHAPMTAQSRNSPTKLSPIKVEHKQKDSFVIQSLGERSL